MLFEDYCPHAAQARFHRESKRFASVAAGARSGKTFAAAREFLKRVYLDRYQKSGALHYWCAAPTYAIGKVQLHAIIEALGGLGGPLIATYHAAERELQLHGDMLIEFKTTERPEMLVAVGLDGLWLDEAARAKGEAWLGGLRMRLTDRCGWAIFSTTPLGRNWFYEHLIRPAEAGEPDYSVHTWRTVDNTAIPGLIDEVDKARRELPEAYFRREFEASFDAFHGQVYPDFIVGLHVTDEEPPAVVETRYGVDWGFRHPGVILCLQRDGLGVWTVVEEIVETGLLVTGDDTRTWVKAAKDLTARRGAGVFFCDPSAPAYIRAFRAAGLDARSADNDLTAGIQTVARVLHLRDGRPGLLVHRRCRRTIEELVSYRWDPDSAGECPLKENDHACDALRYGLHTRLHRPAQW